MIQSIKLRPGLLVSLKASVSGNVRYFKTELEAAHVIETGEEKARWETTREITDAAEYEKARTVRNQSAALIRKVCAQSAFGLLCPEIEADKLKAAIEQAQANAAAFNETSTLTTVSIYVMTGRIMPDDVEAVKAINSEIKGLMDDVNQGLANMDVKAVRDAASKLKQMGQMLPVETQVRTQMAVELARKAASDMAKKADDAAKEVDKITIAKITDLRTAFLDLDDAKPISAPTAAAGVAVEI